jgi:hypothetical protein
MRFAYLMFCERRPGQDVTIGENSVKNIRKMIAGVPGLTSGLIYTPETAQDLFNNDGDSPPLGLQLYFDELPALEAAVSAGGALEALTAPGLLPSPDQVRITQQAMLVRRFPVDDPLLKTPAGALPCSYVVHYPGPADDLNLWLAHYIAGHPPIMRKFPGIRGIEILSRIDWCGTLPFERVAHMQRNRVLFDSAAALTAALQSPVRHEMRADLHTFPPFQGGNAHYPMATETVTPFNP